MKLTLANGDEKVARCGGGGSAADDVADDVDDVFRLLFPSGAVV